MYVFQGETYIPEVLKDFFTSTAAFIARRSGFVADMAGVEKQLREYFQKNNVRRELISQGEKIIPPEDRKTPHEGFTPSDDDEDDAVSPKKRSKKVVAKKAGTAMKKGSKNVHDSSEDTDAEYEKKKQAKLQKKTYRTRAKAKEDKSAEEKRNSDDEETQSD